MSHCSRRLQSAELSGNSLANLVPPTLGLRSWPWGVRQSDVSLPLLITSSLPQAEPPAVAMRSTRRAAFPFSPAKCNACRVSVPLALQHSLVWPRCARAEVRLGKTTIVGSGFPALKQEFFGGIPFASPPTGSLRFKPPVSQLSLGNVSTLDATKFGASCTQLGVSASSEDCLTLNVFRPAGLKADASLPVMLWIYGGGFQDGQSSDFNASLIVLQSITRGTPVIYASMNYRTGPFGFPQGDEAAAQGSLNLGLHDQVAAMQWVKANIRAFGGDPQKVTIFGQSAGSMSISHHYLNNLADFARAAVNIRVWLGSDSPSVQRIALIPPLVVLCKCNVDLCFLSHIRPEQHVLLSSKCDYCRVGCSMESDCHRQPGAFPFAPVIDGPGGIIPDLPTTRLLAGAGPRIPFMSGTVLDEGTSFTPTIVSSQDQIEEFVEAQFSPSALGPAALNTTLVKLLSLYPEDPAAGSPFFTGNNTFGLSPSYKRATSLVTDLTFLALRRFYGDIAASRGIKMYSYWFTNPQLENPPQVGVTHASEIRYVYGVPPAGNPGAANLSLNMVDYWVSFATSLTPNDGKGSKRPTWELYESKSKRVMMLNATSKMIDDDFHVNQTKFLDLNNTLVTFSQRKRAGLD
ncbi:hypothetical protein EVG20_g1117 [Dentipellis fragilis]|uniref:Carboxylic ester hydrolase n=1 Tax=Dentipellis fragilis TaxID=205917 RepID=A0A4Y9ZDR1_9AGAM|nr:hypothetical protein EVG20_g1117 [Dentipellis fragilis]